MRRSIAYVALSLSVAIIASPLSAQSLPEPTVNIEALALRIEAACLEAAQPIEDATVALDATGDATRAYAMIEGVRENGVRQTRICLYDKASDTVVLSAPLKAAATGPARPATADAEADTASPDPTEDLVFSGEPFPLTAEDRAELLALPNRVRATLADLQAGGWTPGGLAETVLSGLRGGSTRLSAVRPGRYECNVVWYGFLENTRQYIGTHRCRVERDRLGDLVILKLTGQNLNATLLEFNDGDVAFAGRSAPSGSLAQPYDPDRPVDRFNPNFGNVVGRVVTDGRRIYLIDINQRGMTEPDPTYFQVIELVP
ncbi:hypothetical protein B7H23_01685 [Notoacmeibacter marinus]|uniref:Uncharacterized protein n=1 Tax=Notoacmeibacter marinus TaxID=1876515 RepID=A0A231V0I2_9HYPH|nr:hypothetical protein [Notoacmeibacter marinus]OXT01698.1 hypothetical protein B7H23_01685 [Notoacmeibacter marinus]